MRFEHFVGVSWAFHGHFTGISLAFHGRFLRFGRYLRLKLVSNWKPLRSDFQHDVFKHYVDEVAKSVAGEKFEQHPFVFALRMLDINMEDLKVGEKLKDNNAAFKGN